MGFITGELIQYAIVRDEERYRPLVLGNAMYKAKPEDEYLPIAGERFMVDAGDALILSVTYMPLEQVVTEAV